MSPVSTKQPHLCMVCEYIGKPGSSFSIVSGNGMEDRAIEVRSPAEAKGFFL
jgi:hypothetical protein